MLVMCASSKYMSRAIKLKGICFQEAVESEEMYIHWTLSVGEKGQQRVQPLRQLRRVGQPETGTKENCSSASAGRTKGHFLSIYLVLFWGSWFKLKKQSMVIARSLCYILSTLIYKKRITFYVSNPEKRQVTICFLKFHLHMTGQ